MGVSKKVAEGIAEELGSLFRLGSKKYYDRFYCSSEKYERSDYIEQKKKRQKALTDRSRPEIRQIEPYAVFLRSLRISAGLTQQEMASIMRTKQSAISRFESGLTKPSTRFLERYAQAVGAELVLIVRPISNRGQNTKVK